METYSFSYSSPGLTTTITFQPKTEDLTIQSFSALCAIAARAFGYGAQNIEDVFGDHEEELFGELNEDNE